MERPLYPKRKSTRLAGYGYNQKGAYFITICTHDRTPFLGAIGNDGVMILSAYGEAVAQSWDELSMRFQHIQLDAYMIMPNHIHGIIVIAEEDGPSLSAIIRAFKSCASRRIKEVGQVEDQGIWQRGFYDHVIRNDKFLQAIREYIANNPARWADDELNPQRNT